MNLHQIEAIVLQSIPFKEYDRILTLFSPQGMLKLIAKGRKKDYLHLNALTSPLTHGEFHYTQGRKDLHKLSEGSVLRQNLKIRDRYETLTTAEKMIRALFKSQWPGKAAPKLFSLFAQFLDHLPKSLPETLYTVFLLKILRHEGVLELKAPLEACSRLGGERHPPNQPPPSALPFTEEEEQLLTELSLSRSLSACSITIPNNFARKIETLFAQAFE